jgi:pectinesterase
MRIPGRLAVVCLVGAAAPALAQTPALTLKAVNPLDSPRPSETIELSAKDLAPLGEKDLHKIHVTDAAGKERLCQAVDTDGDTLRLPDQVIFQSDFGPKETQTFKVTVGTKWVYKKDDYRAFGRFNRERFDDYAWENDRTAHRMYGEALETWEGEPLTSSSVDIWSKRTPRMIVNDWYMVDNYHADTGEGADFYSAGATRGVGGNGLWADGKLWVSKNFVATRTLAAGPIRVLFELSYDAFDVNGNAVSEVKRIRLDAGQNLNRFESRYTPARAGALVTAIGIRKADVAQKDWNADIGRLATWEPVKKGAAGNQGVAVVVDPKLLQQTTEDDKNLLVLAKVPEQAIVYWAGGTWDKAGHFADFMAWKTYVDAFVRGQQAPIQISLTP